MDKPWTDRDLSKQIATRYSQGQTIPVLSRVFKLPESSIRKCIVSMSVPLRSDGRNYSLSEGDRREVARLWYMERKTYAELAEQFSISHGTVGNILVEVLGVDYKHKRAMGVPFEEL